MTEGLFFINGVNGSTGTYLLPPLTPEIISRHARGEQLDPMALR